MPTVWSKPGLLTEPVTLAANLLDSLADQHHPKLVEAGARVAVAFAANDKGPALKHDRRPAAAIVRVLPAMWRVLFGYDALVQVDGTLWEALDGRAQRALIDHELRHLVPVERPAAGDRVAYQMDNQGRPKLRIDPGDFYVGDGFLDVIDRHGTAALEVGPIREAHALVMAHLPEVLARDRPPPDRNGD